MNVKRTRPFVGIKSAVLLVVALGAFAWANSQVRSWSPDVEKSGFPLLCRSEHWVMRTEPVANSDVLALHRTEESWVVVHRNRRAFNAAVALSVSLVLALVSERFVFSRLGAVESTPRASNTPLQQTSGAAPPSGE